MLALDCYHTIRFNSARFPPISFLPPFHINTPEASRPPCPKSQTSQPNPPYKSPSPVHSHKATAQIRNQRNAMITLAGPSSDPPNRPPSTPPLSTPCAPPRRSAARPAAARAPQAPRITKPASRPTSATSRSGAPICWHSGGARA